MMSDELKIVKEHRERCLRWLAEIDEQIAELEKPKQWEPKSGSWLISSNGRPMKTITMTKSQLFGTERETEKQAEQAAVSIRRFNRLLAYRDEFAPGYVFQYGARNYYIFAQDRLWIAGGTILNYSPAQVYFPEDVANELCRKLTSGEVIL